MALISAPVSRDRRNVSIASTRSAGVLCGIRRGADERSSSAAAPPPGIVAATSQPSALSSPPPQQQPQRATPHTPRASTNQPTSCAGHVRALRCNLIWGLLGGRGLGLVGAELLPELLGGVERGGPWSGACADGDLGGQGLKQRPGRRRRSRSPPSRRAGRRARASPGPRPGAIRSSVMTTDRRAGLVEVAHDVSGHLGIARERERHQPVAWLQIDQVVRDPGLPGGDRPDVREQRVQQVVGVLGQRRRLADSQRCRACRCPCAAAPPPSRSPPGRCVARVVARSARARSTQRSRTPPADAGAGAASSRPWRRRSIASSRRASCSSREAGEPDPRRRICTTAALLTPAFAASDSAVSNGACDVVCRAAGGQSGGRSATAGQGGCGSCRPRPSHSRAQSYGRPRCQAGVDAGGGRPALGDGGDDQVGAAHAVAGGEHAGDAGRARPRRPATVPAVTVTPSWS